MKNQYFCAVVHTGEDEFKTLTCIHIYSERYVWGEIANKYLNTFEYAQKSHEDPYGSIYHLDIKEYIFNDYPNVYEMLKQSLLSIGENITNPQIKICMATSHEYRKFDEKFDNEMSFLEYINSETAEMDKNRPITVEILKEAGFEDVTHDYEKQFHKEYDGLDDYVTLRRWTDDTDKNPEKVLKLDIDNGLTNNGAKWNLHIDNNVCSTVGSADIDTVWQFNTLMQVFGSRFRL